MFTYLQHISGLNNLALPGREFPQLCQFKMGYEQQNITSNMWIIVSCNVVLAATINKPMMKRKES